MTCINHLGSSIQTCVLSIQTVTCNNIIMGTASSFTVNVQGKPRFFLFFSNPLIIPLTTYCHFLAGDSYIDYICYKIYSFFKFTLETSGHYNESVSIVYGYDHQNHIKRLFLELNETVSV